MSSPNNTKLVEVTDVNSQFLSNYLYDPTNPYLGAGMFGCTIRAVYLGSAETYSVALKLQYHSSARESEDSPDPLVEFDFLEKASKISTDPFVLKVYRIYKIPLPDVIPHLDSLIPEKCTELKRRLRVEYQRRAQEPAQLSHCNLYATEMELADGALPGLLASRGFHLSQPQLRNLSFAIAYNMFQLQTSLKMRHRDLHLSNVLFKTKDYRSVMVYRFLVEDSEWEITLSSAMPCIPVVADFGLARVGNRGPTQQARNLYVMPLTYLFSYSPSTLPSHLSSSSSLYLMSREDLFATDVWSFGFLLLSIALSSVPLPSWILEEIRFGEGEVFPDAEDRSRVRILADSVYQFGSLHTGLIDLATQYLREIQTKASGVAGPSYDTELVKPVPVDTKLARHVAGLMFLCLLQEKLGNGFLPEFMSFTERGPLFSKFDVNYVAIEAAFQKANRDPHRSTRSESLLDMLLVGVKEVLTAEGVDLVRKCLCWNPEERGLLSSAENRFRGYKNFIAVLEHNYFDSLRSSLVQTFVNVKVTDPETREGEGEALKL